MKMSTGTKSVLFGVHQFIWHPITVLLAWIDLYGMPKPWELFCILVHDIGYLGKPDMNGTEGSRHPELGAKIAGAVFGEKARIECLCHSRSYALANNLPTSRLCWADKWSPNFDPTLFYCVRALLSKEIREYQKEFLEEYSKDSYTWTKAFKNYVRKNAAAIRNGARGNPNPEYHINGKPPISAPAQAAA